MGDVEELCERILMIKGGHVGFDGSTKALHHLVGIPSALEVAFGGWNGTGVQGVTGVSEGGRSAKNRHGPNLPQTG